MATSPDAGLWSAILPVLACAVCPAGLTADAKVFTVLGIAPRSA